MICQTLGWSLFLIEGGGTNLYVKRAGDSMLGQLKTIPPVDGDDATNVEFVNQRIDETIGSINPANYVLEAGDNMTGNLGVPNPVTGSHAVNLQTQEAAPPPV